MKLAVGLCLSPSAERRHKLLLDKLLILAIRAAPLGQLFPIPMRKCSNPTKPH